MAEVQGVVEKVINPDKYGKVSMVVGGNWYNTKPEWLPTVPSEGQEVVFDNGGKKYINKLRIVGSGTASAIKSSAPKGDHLLGVKLGHASNIAKDVAFALQGGESEPYDVEQWYRDWLNHTQRVFDSMESLRDVTEKKPKISAVVTPPPELDTDLF
jgi:hypothetical protein